jgi:NADPH:quinone reductase-like Zn-dependent oxidoreductase
MLGAEVIACASSAAKLQRLKALGADHVLNYQEVDFSKWVIDTYGKPQRRSYAGGVDVVINFTGGDTWHPSLRCMKRGGSLLVCGAPAGYEFGTLLHDIENVNLINHWLEQFLQRGSHGPHDDGRARDAQTSDRLRAAAEPGTGRAAPDSGPGSHRQGGHQARGRG